jgi:hypothetical protein
MIKNLSFVQLNEVNFDIVKKYVNENPGRYKGFEHLFTLNEYSTYSEQEYNLLEPWIQWASVHTEKTYAEHNIYRLGDVVTADHDQIFEKIERLGYTVGCVSPMNALNRLKFPAFFIPDPWTDTTSDKSFVSKSLHKALRQAVNDNSQERLSPSTILVLLLCFIFYSNKKNIIQYIKLFLKRKKRWNKALFLDLFLTDLYIQKLKSAKPNFGTLFLNAFAHIQHHYFLNSRYSRNELKNDGDYISTDDDPLKDAIEVYDLIMKQLLKLAGYQNMLATGLSQVPVENKITYYRLKNHEEFLKLCGLKNFFVEPRMTRDFKITFYDETSRSEGEHIMEKLTCKGENLFGVIDKRPESTFCTLTYSHALDEGSIISINNECLSLIEHFVFVAYKNGEHNGQGYLFTDIQTDIFTQNSPEHHVKRVGTEILHYFESSKLA